MKTLVPGAGLEPAHHQYLLSSMDFQGISDLIIEYIGCNAGPTKRMGGDILAIARVCVKYRLKEEPSDASFWRSRPETDRLAALEEIRREYHLWKYHAEPRFQRIYTIAER